MSSLILLDGSVSIPDAVEGVLSRLAVRDGNRLSRLLGVTLGCTFALAGLLHCQKMQKHRMEWDELTVSCGGGNARGGNTGGGNAGGGNAKLDLEPKSLRPGACSSSGSGCSGTL